MIWIYNFLIIALAVVTFPFFLFKLIFDKRLRYGFKYRFFPVSIKDKNYILVHVSSFGEAKTILSFSDVFEENFKAKIIYSVFTDTAHSLVKNRTSFLMPLDFYPLYALIFKTKPKFAIFFETEIWPSYLTFLKNRGVPLILINARMSNRSFRIYKKLSFFFGSVIKSFDLIIAKSKEDAKRFKYFNTKTIVCGNIKKFKIKQVFGDVLKEFKIKSSKPILTLASFHKEEIDFAVSLIKELRGEFFIIIAPRHLEDLNSFELKFKMNGIVYAKRTDNIDSESIMLLDTMGELEKAYSVSDVSIVGGSFHPSLKGHNPIEPLVYNNLVVLGPFVESFREEVEELANNGWVCVVGRNEDYLAQVNKCITGFRKIDTEGFFDNLKYILNCYIIHTMKAKKL